MSPGGVPLTLEPEDQIPQVDAETVKRSMSQNMDLRMDLPIIKPGDVSQPYENPHTDASVYIPGTSIHEPSTKPRDDPRERPVHGQRAHTAPYSAIEHFSYGPDLQEAHDQLPLFEPEHL
mmetsp:Transcript_44552/g.59103  ORF Transcript_44552/g.59103 Transcript_44552/m.59103 type:complete len:120 (+) Transcript_44552:186-545(+)